MYRKQPRTRGLFQDSTGSVTVTAENIKLENVPEEGGTYEGSVVDLMQKVLVLTVDTNQELWECQKICMNFTFRESRVNSICNREKLNFSATIRGF